MKGVNKVILLGSVGKDPEIRSTAGGSTVASFSIATNDRTKKDGEWVDSVEWHSLVAFGRTAEVVRDYLKKGNQVYVEGKITTRSWDDKQSGEKKYKTEVLVNELVLLGGPKSDDFTGANQVSRPSRQAQKPASDDPFGDGTGISDSDLPTSMFDNSDDPF